MNKTTKVLLYLTFICQSAVEISASLVDPNVAILQRIHAINKEVRARQARILELESNSAKILQDIYNNPGHFFAMTGLSASEAAAAESLAVQAELAPEQKAIKTLTSEKEKLVAQHKANRAKAASSVASATTTAAAPSTSLSSVPAVTAGTTATSATAIAPATSPSSATTSSSSSTVSPRIQDFVALLNDPEFQKEIGVGSPALSETEYQKVRDDFIKENPISA